MVILSLEPKRGVSLNSLALAISIATETACDLLFLWGLQKGVKSKPVLATGPVCAGRNDREDSHALLARHIFVTSLAPVRADINCDSGIR